LRAAPGDAVEEPRRDAPQRDERVAAVLGRRKDGVGAAGEPARGLPQRRRTQHRAIRADEDHALGAAQALAKGVQHARAEIRAALAAQAPQLHASEPRRARRGEGAAREARVQPRRARGAEQRDEARLDAARARLAREDDDASPRIGAPAHRDRRRASRRSAAAT
jgi:hypothetical protein